jgi:acetylornithine aminotransferase
MLGTTFGGNQLACAAAIAVLEVIEMEGLIENAATTGDYLMQSLREIPELKNVRGRGLMIGFDMPDSHIDLRKKLLTDHFIFTGEAKPNVIRLLPSLALNRGEADEFLEAVRKEISVPVG